MNTVVGKLLEVDREARRILDEAQQYYDKTIEEIDKERQRLLDKYAEKAAMHIDDVRRAESADADDHLDQSRQRFAALLAEMERNYNDNHTAWEDELFRRTVQG